MVRSHEIRDKWIFKKKTDMDGNVTVYEARLVAEEYFHKFKELTTMRFFSSVAMLKSVGIMLALAAFMKSGRWMSRQVSLLVFVRKGCMQYNQKGFVDPKDAKRYASSSNPSMDWIKHFGVGICALMR